MTQLLTCKQHKLLSRMLRVNHSGEVGANTIYKGQLLVLGRDAEIEHMLEQEKKHVEAFNKILPQTRTRPSLLLPLWSAGGYLLGVSTALLGRKAAMACTESVETVISDHYNDQIRTLLEMPPSESSKQLLTLLQEFRDDEEEHRQHAVEAGSQEAPGYWFLHHGIKMACKVCIKIAERV